MLEIRPCHDAEEEEEECTYLSFAFALAGMQSLYPVAVCCRLSQSHVLARVLLPKLAVEFGLFTKIIAGFHSTGIGGDIKFLVVCRRFCGYVECVILVIH